jgi:8-oxo-dGTP pyrophosphatase MutT (NUDIX family)
MADGVVRLERCSLHLVRAPWRYAERHRPAIAAHWDGVQRARPQMWNGVIHIAVAHAVEGTAFRATYARTDFASYLHWRETGFADPGTVDAFGSALVRSAEGHVVLGVQGPGQLNSGLAYPPGGFVDARDIGPDGVVDIEASIARELAEETGLTASELRREPGYLITRAGPLVSIGALFRSPLSSEALQGRVRAHLANEREPELADVMVIRSPAAAAAMAAPEFARTAVTALIATG